MSVGVSQSGRQRIESFLLYRYLQEHGESILCNFGWFPPRYRKSTNRNEKKRGGNWQKTLWIIRHVAWCFRRIPPWY
jgi:hypothetical protein